MIELGVFPQVKRGFYCDDRTITMPYHGETITTGALMIAVLFMYPILWICEACYFVPVSLKSSRFIESARRAWRWFKEYLFGVTLHLFVIDGIKVGRSWSFLCTYKSMPFSLALFFSSDLFTTFNVVTNIFEWLRSNSCTLCVLGTVWRVETTFLGHLSPRRIANLYGRVSFSFSSLQRTLVLFLPIS